MKALVQRVLQASVTVDGSIVSQIGKGFLVLLGVEKDDTPKQADFLAHKISALRIFEDNQGKMNLNLSDVDGSVLLVSQFTLAADTSRGNRPGFETAARPDKANELYLYMIEKLKSYQLDVKTGIFQADMKVALINDGPATFMLEKKGESDNG